MSAVGEACEACRIARLVGGDMSNAASMAARSAEARHGLSDQELLLAHAATLARWSGRLRMALAGAYYRGGDR